MLNLGGCANINGNANTPFPYFVVVVAYTIKYIENMMFISKKGKKILLLEKAISLTIIIKATGKWLATRCTANI